MAFCGPYSNTTYCNATSCINSEVLCGISPKNTCRICKTFPATCTITFRASRPPTCSPCVPPPPQLSRKPTLPKEPICERIIRPKPYMFDKAYWCQCRPPMDKRKCKICKKRARQLKKQRELQQILEQQRYEEMLELRH